MYVIVGSSEISSEELLVLQSLVSVLLPLLRYVAADVENSHEVRVLYILHCRVDKFSVRSHVIQSTKTQTGHLRLLIRGFETLCQLSYICWIIMYT